MRAYVSAILEARGFEVEEAENGFEALRRIGRTPLDLIIADINMPDVNGIELTRFVRRGTTNADLAVLVISTDAAHNDVERALSAGANGFLAKPFTEDELIAAIARIRGEATT